MRTGGQSEAIPEPGRRIGSQLQCRDAPAPTGQRAARILARVTIAQPAGFGPSQQVTVIKVDHAQQVVAVTGQITHACRQGRAVLVHALFVARAGGTRPLEALVILAQNDIDHACDRVGTVNGRSAVFQHFDPLNCGVRNAVQVDKSVLQVLCKAIVGHATAVNQDQRSFLSQAAQRDAGRARRKAVGEGLVEAIARIARQIAKDFTDRQLARFFDVFAGNDLHWGWGFGVNSFDVRAGHLNFFNFLRRRRWCLGKSQWGHHQRCQQCLGQSFHIGASHLSLFWLHNVSHSRDWWHGLTPTVTHCYKLADSSAIMLHFDENP